MKASEAHDPWEEQHHDQQGRTVRCAFFFIEDLDVYLSTINSWFGVGSVRSPLMPDARLRRRTPPSALCATAHPAPGQASFSQAPLSLRKRQLGSGENPELSDRPASVTRRSGVIQQLDGPAERKRRGRS